VTLHTAVVAGHEVRAIIDYIHEHGFDTLLVGYHGHSAISERIRGSTTGSLVLNSPCTVIVVK
jgi:nucleotide-binding universal stress UspA family protein